eukprot:gene119-156_t
MRKAVGMMFHFGMHSVFFTLNPNAAHSMLLLRLTGAAVDVELDVPLDLVQRVSERMLRNARRPWTSAVWFDLFHQIVWRHLLGIDETLATYCRRAMAHETDMYACNGCLPGILGWVVSGIACAESSPGGQLHSHGCFRLLHPPHATARAQLQADLIAVLRGMLHANAAAAAADAPPPHSLGGRAVAPPEFGVSEEPSQPHCVSAPSELAAHELVRRTPLYLEMVQWWGSIAACQPTPDPVDVLAARVGDVVAAPHWGGEAGERRIARVREELGYSADTRAELFRPRREALAPGEPTGGVALAQWPALKERIMVSRPRFYANTLAIERALLLDLKIRAREEREGTTAIFPGLGDAATMLPARFSGHILTQPGRPGATPPTVVVCFGVGRRIPIGCLPPQVADCARQYPHPVPGLLNVLIEFRTERAEHVRGILTPAPWCAQFTTAEEEADRWAVADARRTHEVVLVLQVHFACTLACVRKKDLGRVQVSKGSNRLDYASRCRFMTKSHLACTPHAEASGLQAEAVLSIRAHRTARTTKSRGLRPAPDRPGTQRDPIDLGMLIARRRPPTAAQPGMDQWVGTRTNQYPRHGPAALACNTDLQAMVCLPCPIDLIALPGEDDQAAATGEPGWSCLSAEDVRVWQVRSMHSRARYALGYSFKVQGRYFAESVATIFRGLEFQQMSEGFMEQPAQTRGLERLIRTMVKDDAKNARPLSLLALGLRRPQQNCLYETQRGVCVWAQYTAVVGFVRSVDAGLAVPLEKFAVTSLARGRRVRREGCPEAHEDPSDSQGSSADAVPRPAGVDGTRTRRGQQWHDYAYRPNAYLGGWCYLEFVGLLVATHPAAREIEQARLHPRHFYATRSMFVFDDDGATHHPHRHRQATTLRGWRAIVLPNGHIASPDGSLDDRLNHFLHLVVLLVPWRDPKDLLRYKRVLDECVRGCGGGGAATPDEGWSQVLRLRLLELEDVAGGCYRADDVALSPGAAPLRIPWASLWPELCDLPALTALEEATEAAHIAA